MRRRSGVAVAIGGLTAAAAAVLSGAGFVLTPATGPPGVRFGAFGDPVVEVVAAVGGVGGGAALAVATVWLAARLIARAGAGPALAVNASLIVLFAAAATAGVWIFGRADPPLPPSWSWIRIPLWAGLLGAAVWLAGLVGYAAGRGLGPTEGISRV